MKYFWLIFRCHPGDAVMKIAGGYISIMSLIVFGGTGRFIVDATLTKRVLASKTTRRRLSLKYELMQLRKYTKTQFMPLIFVNPLHKLTDVCRGTSLTMIYRNLVS